MMMTVRKGETQLAADIAESYGVSTDEAFKMMVVGADECYYTLEHKGEKVAELYGFRGLPMPLAQFKIDRVRAFYGFDFDGGVYALMYKGFKVGHCRVTRALYAEPGVLFGELLLGIEGFIFPDVYPI
jgi:hypothetical protein